MTWLTRCHHQDQWLTLFVFFTVFVNLNNTAVTRPVTEIAYRHTCSRKLPVLRTGQTATPTCLGAINRLTDTLPWTTAVLERLGRQRHTDNAARQSSNWNYRVWHRCQQQQPQRPTGWQTWQAHTDIAMRDFISTTDMSPPWVNAFKFQPTTTRRNHR